jgi:hypothetical protein
MSASVLIVDDDPQVVKVVASTRIPHQCYRYSRIAADDTLSASPLNANGMAFGFGYRF